MSRLHDSFFELPDALTSHVGTICLTGLDDHRPVRQPIRALGPFMKYDVLHASVELIVHGVVSAEIDDQAMIGWFDLNDGHYSEARSELTIVGGVPVTLAFRVGELHVEVVFRDEPRHRRTAWGVRNRTRRAAAPPATPSH
jgi:hypothetical protein